MSVLERSHVTDAPIARSRAIAPGDAANATSWMIRDLPVPPHLAVKLPALLMLLISEDVLHGVVVEYLDGRNARPPIFAAFGLAGFLRDALAREYLVAPYPHFELDLLDQASRLGGSGPFLGYDEIAEGNSREGLTLFPLLWLQRSKELDAVETRALLVASQEGLIRIHRGYRLSRILKETTAGRIGAYLAGGFREHCRLAVGTPLRLPGRTLEEEHVVLEVNRSDVERALPGAAMSHLFAYQPPRCGFTRSEKRVLELAADHLTDNEIATQLGITLAAITLRWRSIYARVAERAPSALEFEIEPHALHVARGKEKRRRVIAFVSRHPEEIRPYPQY